MEKFGGRKFIYAMVAVILGFILVVLNKLTPETWTTFVSIIGGTYVIGNVATKVVAKGEA